MNTIEEYVLIAPCGLSCGHCQVYLSKDNPALMKDFITKLSKENPAIAEDLATWNTKRGNLSCPGCRKRNRGEVVGDANKTSHDPLADNSSWRCATYTCSVEHGVDFCYECPEFPCVKLQPCTDMAAVLPQNLKVFNLCSLKRQGPAEWLKNYDEIRNLYYFGKLVVGEGPQIQLAEDGLRAIQERQDFLQRSIKEEDQE